MKTIPVESTLNDLAERVTSVKRWLSILKSLYATSVALGCLAVAAVMCWGLFVGFGWQVAGHCLCGAALLCCTAGAILWIAHVRTEPVTYSEAGATIETSHSLHRQLVTAMEYYEDRVHFPYSRGLTHHMIQRVSRRSRAQDFENCVPKKRAWILGSIIAFELLILGGFVVSECLFWHRHWTQSVQAAGLGFDGKSAVQEEMALTSVTGNILTEPNTLITFEARSDLEDTEFVQFVMTHGDPNSSGDHVLFSCEVPGVKDPQTGAQTFSVQQFCETPGNYQYRFESDTTQTPWSDLTVSPKPQVTAVMTQTPSPDQQDGAAWQPIDQGRVDVVKGREVAFKIQTDQALSEVQVHKNGELIETLTPHGAEAVYQTMPEQNQSLTFTPINAQGQAAEEPVKIEVAVTEDYVPRFELVAPEGDLPLIAPVPVLVEFRIHDDVGLASAEFYYEVNNREPERIEIPVADSTQAVEFAHTLPLDKWRLAEGDTVMFYCQAKDIALDPRNPGQEAASEIYLIEIQREIKIKEPKENPNPMFAETLMDALEYTRAIVKKSWTLSHSPDDPSERLKSSQALIEDLAHTEEVIAKNRDNELLEFSEEDKAVLNRVIDTFSESRQLLDQVQVGNAVDAEKKGYRLLRDFINESDLTPIKSPAAPKPKVPEKIKVQETPEMPHTMDKEEAKTQLETIQKQLQSLTQKQKQLKRALAKTLESQEAVASEAAEQINENHGDSHGQDPSLASSQSPEFNQQESPSSRGSEPSGQGQSQSPGQGQGQSSSQSPGQGQGQGQGQSGSQGQGQSNSGQSSQLSGRGSSQGQGQGQGQSGQSSQANSSLGTGPDQGPSGQSSGHSMSQGQGHASKGTRLAMLEARQKALQSMADQIEEALDRVAKGAQGTEGRVSEQAAQHLQDASEAMDQVETQLDSMQQAPDHAALSQNKVPLDVLDRILDQLDLADTAMDDSLLDTPLDKQIKQAQKITDELMQDIEGMDKAPQTVDAEAMKRKLKNAERLLDNLVQAQSTVVKKGPRGEGLPNSFALTDLQVTPLSKAARQMVHRLWTAMAAVNQSEGQALEMPGSASQFWESENAFFERASRFQGRTVDE